MNELDVALSVADGDLPNPTPFGNSFYVALRISGTGCRWRNAAREFVWRDPATWLSDEMRRRVLGLLVIVEHPGTPVMTSRYFGDRGVGAIVHSFTRDGELFGVARIIDSTACRMIADGMFDTSPCVVFADSAGATIDVEGRRLLVEASPEFIDHIALVYVGAGNSGVWTRQDGENGPGIPLTGTEAAKNTQ